MFNAFSTVPTSSSQFFTLKLSRILKEWGVPEELRSKWLFGVSRIRAWCYQQCDQESCFVLLDKSKHSATIHLNYWTFSVNRKHLKVNGVNLNSNEFDDAITAMMSQLDCVKAGTPYGGAPAWTPYPSPAPVLPGQFNGSFGNRPDEDPNFQTFDDFLRNKHTIISDTDDPTANADAPKGRKKK